MITFLVVCAVVKLALTATLWLLLGPKRLRKAQPPTKKKIFEFECWGWLARKILEKKGAIEFGFTLPLPFCQLILYAVTEETPEETKKIVRVHEFVHVAQDERNACFLVTWFNYLAEDARLILGGKKVWEAYRANKYEAEAYEYQWRVLDGSLPWPDWAL
jgi:hypothetical protein